jgi:hypothetical protein
MRVWYELCNQSYVHQSICLLQTMLALAAEVKHEHAHSPCQFHCFADIVLSDSFYY